MTRYEHAKPKETAKGNEKEVNQGGVNGTWSGIIHVMPLPPPLLGHPTPSLQRMWTCSPVQFETQPLERSRGLIPGTLLLLHKADGSYSLLWEPSISAGTDYHVEFPLRRIVTLRRSKGPRVAFVLTKGGSVGPFLFPGEDQYERLLRKLVELNVIDPDSLSKVCFACTVYILCVDFLFSLLSRCLSVCGYSSAYRASTLAFALSLLLPPPPNPKIRCCLRSLLCFTAPPCTYSSAYNSFHRLMR